MEEIYLISPIFDLETKAILFCNSFNKKEEIIGGNGLYSFVANNNYEGWLKALARDLISDYPGSTYFVMHQNDIIGITHINHVLNPINKLIGGHISLSIKPNMRNKGYGKKTLKIVLEKCHELGIDEILMTCDINNVVSMKNIEHFGGVMENMRVNPSDGKNMCRYWIDNTKENNKLR